MKQLKISKNVHVGQLHREIIDAGINVESINYNGNLLDLKLMEDGKEIQLRQLISNHSITPPRNLKAEYGALSTDSQKTDFIAGILELK